MKGSNLQGYPGYKLVLNRLGNQLIRLLFMISYNDITNAFKAYRREVVRTVLPLQSRHFNITAEIPLKAMARGFNYAVVPINWYGRTSGESKLKIRRMARRYFYTILSVWLEKHLVPEDFPSKGTSELE